VVSCGQVSKSLDDSQTEPIGTDIVYHQLPTSGGHQGNLATLWYSLAVADLMLPTTDPDWRADTTSFLPDDPTEDSLDPDNALKRDRAGDALHTAGDSNSSSSSDPVYILSACTCVNSRSVRRLVSDEMLLTAMCHCASRNAGDYG